MTAEKHVRYSDDVDTLPEAWEFIMRYVDEFTAPSIAIEAFTRYAYDEDVNDGTPGYTASIHGNVNA